MGSLQDILSQEIQWDASGVAKVKTFFLYNPHNRTYAVNVVDHPTRYYPAGVVVLARIEGDTIIIEEDRSDHPLYKKLIERGIPMQKIICAYAGESQAITSQ